MRFDFATAQRIVFGMGVLTAGPLARDLGLPPAILAKAM
jgi:hypothetical protein